MFSWLKKKVFDTSVRPAQGAKASLTPEENCKAHLTQGNAWLDKGNLEVAADCYRKAVDVDPLSIDARVNLGFALVELRRYVEAQPILEEAVRLDPNSHDAFFLLGTAQNALGSRDLAIAAWRRAISRKPDFQTCRKALVQALVESGEIEAARLIVCDGLALAPDSADLYYYLGNIDASREAFESAAESYEKALARNPSFAEAHQALGEALKRQGKFEAAIESHRRSVTLNPGSADARARLAAVLHDHGQLDNAVACYRQALALDAEHAEVYVNMGYALQQLGQLAAAVESYGMAIKLRPEFAGAHTNLGDALSEQGKLEEAVCSYRRALDLQPNDGRAHNNLAGALLGQGKLDAAVEGYQSALALVPEYITAYSNMLFALNYHPDKSAEEIFSVYREFDRRFTLPMREDEVRHANDRATGRRLKVGYLSPDFRRHAARHFLEPLFEHHDKSAVEVHAYADVLVEDAVTASYRRFADRWISIRGMSDSAVAERIRHDGIDILVELAGHTGNNRLGIFARKPAPVSLTWMGYGYTTGLSAIDYFLTDWSGAPAGCEPLFSEEPWRIATPAYVFRPAESMGDVGTLPALRRGRVTFGTLTRAIRINHRAIKVWSEILRRVEGSHLVIDSVNFQDASMQEDMAARFAAHGIARERLEIGFHTPPWDVMRGIDIGLDCFPHNSGTTLFESLYMGLPFVTLAGRPSVGRLGSSILHGVEHAEWIADSEADYIDKAVALASDVPRLAAIRAGLRAEMQACPLMDEPGFARKIEAAYREMFERWSHRQTSLPVASVDRPTLAAHGVNAP
jgi:predicted O-linked N-acetylglucosamine transferase (SPINDLY family)